MPTTDAVDMTDTDTTKKMCDMALFGLLVNSSAAGAVLKEDVPDLGNRNIHSPVPQQTGDDCPPPNKTDWCLSNDPLKWEVPDLGSRNIH